MKVNGHHLIVLGERPRVLLSREAKDRCETLTFLDTCPVPFKTPAFLSALQWGKGKIDCELCIPLKEMKGVWQTNEKWQAPAPQLLEVTLTACQLRMEEDMPRVTKKFIP